MISPWTRTNVPSGVAAQARQPPATSSSSAAVAMPYSTAWAARLEATTRSAHRSPHQARSAGVAKVHVEVE